MLRITDLRSFHSVPSNSMFMIFDDLNQFLGFAIKTRINESIAFIKYFNDSNDEGETITLKPTGRLISETFRLTDDFRFFDYYTVIFLSNEDVQQMFDTYRKVIGDLIGQLSFFEKETDEAEMTPLTDKSSNFSEILNKRFIDMMIRLENFKYVFRDKMQGLDRMLYAMKGSMKK